MAFLLVSIFMVFSVTLTVQVGEECSTECVQRGVSTERGFDLNCNDTCRLQQCHYGCERWKEGHGPLCHNICQSKTRVYQTGSLYCIMGCNLAITSYIENLKQIIGTPAAPFLSAELKTNDSITLQWNPAPYDNITYLVQWRYDFPSTTWDYYKPEQPLRTNKIRIEGLHPFVKYKFRVAWILLAEYTPILSEESIAIATLPYGAPSSRPIITRLTAVSPTHISISWKPPLFPNGPILSYVLYLTEHQEGSITTVMEVDHKSGGLYYMFNNLKPQTLYNISITTRNEFGEGPADIRITETPPPKRESTDVPQSFLLLANQGKLLKQRIKINDQSEVVYDSKNPLVNIKGVAIHVEQKLIFVSDSTGSIHSISMQERKHPKTIVHRRPTLPEVLSMDWLNDKLYMVEENQISRCDLKCHNTEVVIKGFTTRSPYMMADSYHGFLYWINLVGDVANLHKVDLKLLENGHVWLKNTQKIYTSSTFVSFTIDYINFRIMVPKPKNNTVSSLSLDGTDEIDIRKNSQNPQFTNVKSLILYNNLFIWESGDKVFGEEYTPQRDKYYANDVYFLKHNRTFSNLNLFHPYIQPYPVPLDPVEDVQVLFDVEIGKISWNKPKLLGVLGKGAWQDWLYEVQLLDHEMKKFETNVSGTSYTFHDLYPNTLYSIKVRAFSPGGKGPWSKAFHGKTLKPSTVGYPYIVWSTGGKLATSNLLGDDIKPLILASSFDQVHITDVSWYNQTVFLATNNSNIHVYNTKSKLLSTLSNIANVTSIAVDWLAPKLYWSSPIKQMISRANLDGGEAEHFPIITIARELAIDSLSAYIYWATTHSVEYSRLNGMQHQLYFQTNLFSGKYVMGLAIDLDGQNVFWSIRSYEGTMLYKAPLAHKIADNIKLQVETVASLEEHDVTGPLGLYSERLFWLKDGQNAIISNLTGNNIAYLKGLELYKPQTLAVVDPSLHYFPGRDRNKINVIPTQIEENQITVNGTWDKFYIVWNLESGVNYGKVFYEMKIETERKSYTSITEKTYYQFPTEIALPPYSSLKIELKAFTFWASSRKTAVTLHSPMSVPSQPIHPRVFISFKRSPLQSRYQIDAEFRWKPPVHRNGVILGYIINCWFAYDRQNIPVVTELKLNGSQLKFEYHDLMPNMTYYFQVFSYTKAGKGPSSDIAKADTSVELPVPKLLLAKNDAVKVTDIDTQEEQLLSNKVSPPIGVACMAREGKVFWIEENGSLMTSKIDGSNAILIRNLPHKSTSLTADWIARKLFWTEIDGNKGSIWALDLNYNSDPILLLNKSSYIASVEVEPFTGLLFWTLINANGIGQMMISDTEGRNIRPFFSQNDYLYYNRTHRPKREKCNCPVAPRVGSAVAIDYTDRQPEILWVNGEQGHIWSSDLRGCTCYLLLSAPPNRDIGLPPTSIAVDKTKLYWSNSAKGRVYSIPKKRIVSSDPAAQHSQRHDITYEVVGRVRGIRAVAESLQPLPDDKCLFPEEYNGTATLLFSTATSFLLKLDPARLDPSCHNVSPSSIKYTVYYDSDGLKCLQNHKNHCPQSETYNTTITISNLQPFTNYSVSVAISNYYSQQNDLVGPLKIFQTKAGVPISPRNVRATTVSPNQIDVFWEPPKILKGGPMKYELRWRSDSENRTLESAISVSTSSYFNKPYQASLKDLNQSTRYFIIVRAYSKDGEMYSDSYQVTATTYRIPSDLILISATSESFILQWRSPADLIYTHALEITRISPEELFFYEIYTSRPKTLYNFTVTNLLPKTEYSARLVLTYHPRNVTYIHPQNEKSFIFKTIGDKPDVPGTPFVRKIRAGVYQVIWEGVRRFNDEFLTYELQFCPLDNDDDKVLNWKTAINTSNTKWIIEDNLPVKVTYLFRVSATNEYGSSNYSGVSVKFFLPSPGGFMDPEDEQMAIILASMLATVILIVIFLIIGLCIAKSQNKKEKSMLQMSIQSHSPHVELATLQELPQNENFVHENNQLYGLGDTAHDEELTGSQQIRREQIVLTKFLGRGAFGEVFEGIAHELMGEGTPPVRVAVKTLRKGASDQEKAGFLKEAKLMSNFHHDHILKLLGVCLDNNINFIILELMESGDLLSYLRANRPTVRCASPLTLDDLMSICVDVASGCKYLEEMHFVHRDLAARNCLVSGNDSSNRIVKIGDFGLARDIYKNDYYRKEGEGLLPVRWLSPESLMDGVFTTQSDIWAFGVLLWEVMTLGQQPYPARSNLEVLQYIKEGGHLDKPDNCPDNFYQLMLLCWNYSPFDRPTFSYCLQRLQELRQTTANRLIPFASVHNHMYCSSVTTDDDSTSFLMRENYIDTELSSMTTPSLDNSYRHRNANRMNRRKNRRRTFSVNDNSDSLTRTGLECGIWHTSCPQVNMSLPAETVKYLELLPDQEDSSDGYEIPLRLQLKNWRDYGRINTTRPPYSRDSRSCSSDQSFL